MAPDILSHRITHARIEGDREKRFRRNPHKIREKNREESKLYPGVPFLLLYVPEHWCQEHNGRENRGKVKIDLHADVE